MKLIALLLLVVVAAAQANQLTFNEDQTRLLLGQKMLLDSQKDGFMHLSKIRYAPDGKRFFVLACGYECTDNAGFLFNADGTGKRPFTTRWDWILQEAVEWSADNRFVYYYRINSTGADPPANAPQEGWMQVEVKTGAKAVARARRLKTTVTYGVFRVRFDDALNIRSAPELSAKVISQIPSDGKGLHYLGATKLVGQEVWVKIKFGAIIGWVKQSYLYEDAK
jgi:hypothetical protein